VVTGGGIALMVTGGGIALMVGLAALALSRPESPATSGPGIAGASLPQASQSSRAGGAAGLQLMLVSETFDGLFIDSPLPQPWSSEGSGTVAIVALPTSVDRSVRLRSDPSGATVSACRPISDVPSSTGPIVDVDLMLVSLPTTSPSPLVRLRVGSRDVVAIGVDPTGAIVDSGSRPDASGKLLTGIWTHLSLAVDRETKSVSWQLRAADGTAIAPPHPAALVGGASAAIDSICLTSPAGAGSGAVIANNLTVHE
jgi:hypothetical protein